ncbi:MAG: DUF4430 domain-containing protein [Solirubrobacterales bacterium]|nr:DUF4430 domain-containing protein [Solirubrobacterales bacterium]MBV9716694.1 DUF4430 domain-containing protein [Solirubrobacterales bacterium]
MKSRAAATAVAIGCAVVVAGCGLGAGKGTSDVTLTVSRDFGTSAVASTAEPNVPGSETVMRMLERSARVTTRYGGGFVESIDGLSGNSARRDWFYYVNGIEAVAGAAETAVHRGDRIWWDLHDWTVTESIPAVVGSYPEPFLHGIAGKRLPTALECGGRDAAACRTVTAALSALGVPSATQLLGTGSGTDSLTVDVGTWAELRPQIVADVIEKGPSLSGVYARFNPAGSAILLLDPRGRVVASLGPGAGLIAATASHGFAPTWLVTGTDPQGVQAAARALTVARLRNRFALAVQGGRDFPLPLEGST